MNNVYLKYFDDKCLILLMLLIKHADNNTWKIINEIITPCEKVKKGHLIKTIKEDYIYKVFYKCLVKKDENILSRLSAFIFRLVEVIEKTSHVDINKECISDIQKLISLIEEFKLFLYWCPCNDKEEVILYYYQLNEVLNDENAKLYTKKVIAGKHNLYLQIDEHKKVKISEIRKTPRKYVRFFKFYKSYCEAIIKKDDKVYCPWCNPDETLTHTDKQRKCDPCEDISNFIISSGYDKTKLNSKITKHKKAEIIKTIRSRGKILLDIIDDIKTNSETNSLSFDTINKNDFTQIKNKIKKQFQI